MKKKFIAYLIIPTLFLLGACKKEKNDPYSEVSNTWHFKSITIDNIDPSGVVYKTKTFDDSFEDNNLILGNSGLYEVTKSPIFMYNANYCYKGNHGTLKDKGIWEFNRDKNSMWFDRGITEYYNSESGLVFSQKFNYAVTDNEMTLESTDPNVIADFGFNIGRYYFCGLWTDMTNDDPVDGDSDGYRNGYWNGYWYGSPSGNAYILKKDAFYTFWSMGVKEYDDKYYDTDTAGMYLYTNYHTSYLNAYNNGYNDGYNDGQNIDLTTDKTYKIKIVYTKL